MSGTAQPSAVLHVRLAGPFRLSRDAAPVDERELGSRKARQLLKLLAVQRGRLVSVERIVDVLWGTAPPERPADNVATLVSRLRRALGPGAVDGDRTGYRLGAVVQVDIDEAARWLGESRRRLAAGEAALALAAASRAAEALAAPVLEDEPDAEWAGSARDEARDLAQGARRALADAALATGEHQTARSAAEAALAADPFDEAATRLLMRAHRSAGEPGRALTTYAQLAARLATELGADPSPETQTLHLATLRDEAVPVVTAPRVVDGAESLGLVGRSAELRRLRDRWNEAADHRPGLVLVVGEAGIGKTRLCDELGQIAVSTGGTLLAARCYETEQSLFLQPFVDTLAPLVRTLAPGTLRELVADHAPALAGLLPDITAVLGARPAAERSSPEIERRRAFEAMTAFIRGLTDRAPVLLALDDLHNAGLSSVELLHFLVRQARAARLLVVASVRAEEGRHVLVHLGAVAEQLELGPLPDVAVHRLAAAAGQANHAAGILRQTGGHALFVVETLRALAAGETSVPASLEAAVLDRVRRAGSQVDRVVRAAAVLGASFDPAAVAQLLDEPTAAVVSRCEDALAARLLVVAGRHYEFANDLIREVLYATTPSPTRLAYHRRAAELFTQRSEVLATHANAIEDWPRAARAWLHAGQQALARAAADDAAELLTRGLAAAEKADDRDVAAALLVGRGRAREARAAYAEAVADLESAVQIAHQAGDPRLEIVALRALGGDAQAALGRPSDQATAKLQRGLQIAVSIGDQALQADLLGRLAVIATSRLAFTEAIDYGDRAVAAARATGDDRALAAALDGRKTALAYLGEVEVLVPVIQELEPLLRQQGDLFLLHWTVFEAGFPAMAGGDWAGARRHFEQALAINRQSGFPVFASWHTAHLGRLAALQGDYPAARELGERALALYEEMPHVWCGAVSAALLGSTLLYDGDTARAITLFERGARLADQEGAQAYRLRCLAPLAAATGSRALLAEADAMLARVRTPPGTAWLTGDAAYLGVARAWLAHGEPDRARTVLAPLLAALRRQPWVAPLAEASLVDGVAARALGHSAEAGELLRSAAALAERHGLAHVAREAAIVGFGHSDSSAPSE